MKLLDHYKNNILEELTADMPTETRLDIVRGLVARDKLTAREAVWFLTLLGRKHWELTHRFIAADPPESRPELIRVAALAATVVDMTNLLYGEIRREYSAANMPGFDTDIALYKFYRAIILNDTGYVRATLATPTGREYAARPAAFALAVIRETFSPSETPITQMLFEVPGKHIALSDVEELLAADNRNPALEFLPMFAVPEFDPTKESLAEYKEYD